MHELNDRNMECGLDSKLKGLFLFVLFSGFYFTVSACSKCPVVRRAVIWLGSVCCTSSSAGHSAWLFLRGAVRRGHFNK